MSADRTYYPFFTYYFKSSAKIGEIIATMFNKIQKKPSILKVLRQSHAQSEAGKVRNRKLTFNF